MAWSVQRFRLVSAPTEPGLCCDKNGLTLGGALLLLQGVDGLEPRPVSALQRIFDAAYGSGSGIDAESRMRGLWSVARALDKRELSRAMVASVLLKLPEFDEEGLERVDRAEALSKFNYNSGERRDWHGRWTDSGGNRNIVPAQVAGGFPPLAPPIGIPGLGVPKRPDDDYAFPSRSHPNSSTTSSSQAGAGTQSGTVNYCPDPGPDVPHGAGENAKLYQEQVTGLPRGMAVTWNGVTYNGCRESNGTLLEAKGPSYLWMVLRPAWFERTGHV